MLSELRTGCVAYDPRISNTYGYVPSEAVGITFIVLFGISTLLHLGQSIWIRQWWTLLFVIGALTEVIGWIGRTWSAICPYNNDAFLMQITTLIIAPTFWTAALYVILGRLIALAGPHTSPLSPKLYLLIFCLCDLVSLILQAIGGGMASVASSASPPQDTATGTNIMVAGIVFQMAAITVLCVLFAVFLRRVRRGGREPLARRTGILVGAAGASILFIYVRSVYRTVELLQGWDGYLITREVYFVVLDGAMMVAAVGVFNAVHPGWFLRGEKTTTTMTGGEREREKGGVCLAPGGAV